jgi:hypothetical protein
MEEKDRLDQLLDEALAECRSVSPREGLERRILAALLTERPRSKWLWWWVAGPTLAASLLLIFLVPHQPNNKTPDTTKTALVTLPKSTAQSAASSAPPTRVQRHRVRKSARAQASVTAKQPERAEPRLSKFPSPGDGEEARLLKEFVSQYPATAQAMVKEQQQFWAKAAHEDTSRSEEQ